HIHFARLVAQAFFLEAEAYAARGARAPGVMQRQHGQSSRLGLRRFWSQSMRLICLTRIRQPLRSRARRCAFQPANVRVSPPRNSVRRKFERTMQTASFAQAKTSTFDTMRLVRDCGTCDQA